MQRLPQSGLLILFIVAVTFLPAAHKLLGVCHHDDQGNHPCPLCQLAQTPVEIGLSLDPLIPTQGLIYALCVSPDTPVAGPWILREQARAPPLS